jgi:phosphatidylethanolamine-binding protein (PEBP) family uncharacterized protein
MRRLLGVISSLGAIGSAALLLAAIALAGCGSSASGNSSSNGAASHPTTSAASSKKSTVIALTSSAITGNEIPARYTCDGANIAPPLKWGAVPAGIREVVLFALGHESKLPTSTVEWALAGVKPEVHEIAAGQVPAGAFLEEASHGKRSYSICPPKGKPTVFQFAVFAVPEGVTVTRSIAGGALFRNLAEGPPGDRAPASGGFSAIYTRK